MARMKTPDGRIVEAVDVAVKGPNAGKLEFPLADGSTVDITVSVGGIRRALAEFGVLGEPLYSVEPSIQIRFRNIPAEFCLDVESAKPKKRSNQGIEVA